MIAVRLLWLAVLLVAIPAWVGNCFLNVDKPCRNPVFLWISGQMLLWAGFQVICVPVILLEGRMWMVTVAYCGYILVLLAAATVRYFRQSRTLRAVREAKPEKAEIILWVLAGVLLLVQLVLAVLMVYGDGDDAYYVAISAAAEESGRMYQKIPYTGMHTELDVRHGLAPFPIWIAWLAQMTDVTVGSDAFFPFSDNIERAKKSGVKYIAEPGGSVRDDLVIETCDKYDMVMAFTGIRLFHH